MTFIRFLAILFLAISWTFGLVMLIFFINLIVSCVAKIADYVVELISKK